MSNILEEFKSNFFRAFSHGAITKLIALLIGITIDIILAQAGAHIYGLYSFGIAILGILLIISSRGVNEAILLVASSFTSGSSQEKHVFYKWCTFRTAKGILFSTFLGGLAAIFLEKSNTLFDPTFYFIIVISVSFICLTRLIQSAYQAEKNTVKSQLFDSIIRPALFLMGLITLTINDIDINIQNLAYSFAASAIATLPLALIKRDVALTTPTQKKSTYTVMNWNKSANNFFYINVVDFILRRLDVIILSFIISAVDVGGYKLGVKISEIIMLPLWLSNLFIGPFISSMYKKNQHAEMQAILTISTRFSFLIALTGGIFFLFFGRELLAWLDHDFASSFTTAALLIASALIDTACGPVKLFLAMTGHAKTVLKVQGITALISTILLAVFSYMGGALGAAVSILISTLIWNIWLLLYIRMKEGVNTSII